MDPFRKKLMIRAIGAVVWLVGAIIILPVLAYEGCQRFETPQSYYADLAAMEHSGAVLRGWIPPILPDSARNITEWHDPDTGQGEFRFEFDPKDADGFLSDLMLKDDKSGDYVYRDTTFHSLFTFTVDEKRGKARARLAPDPDRGSAETEAQPISGATGS